MSDTTDATQDDVVRELRGRDQVFSFRLGAESIQRKTLECRAADEIERLRAIEDADKREIARLRESITMALEDCESNKVVDAEAYLREALR